MSGRLNLVSCVVPTFRPLTTKNGSFGFTLSQLGRLARTARIEVVVVAVDDDETRRFLAETWSEHPFTDLKTVDCGEYLNRSLARNIGASRASADLLWFLDDDTLVFDPGRVRAILETLPLGTFACGAKRYWAPAKWSQSWLEHALQQPLESLLESCILPCGINRESGYRDLQEFSFIGNCGFVHRRDFESIGGFDAENFPSRREDVELMYRLLLNGLSYRHLFDELEVVHLTHPAVTASPSERLEYHGRFEEHERATGYRFKVNHLFGIFEEDGRAVLEPLEDSNLQLG